MSHIARLLRIVSWSLAGSVVFLSFRSDMTGYDLVISSSDLSGEAQDLPELTAAAQEVPVVHRTFPICSTFHDRINSMGNLFTL